MVKCIQLRTASLFNAVFFLLSMGFGHAAHAQLFGAEGITTGSVNAVQAFANYQQFADGFYERGEYPKAIRHYKTLAEYGDHFAQYRLATIFEEGLGVNQSLEEAFAWSYLASEGKREIFKEYHRQIKEALTPEQLESARELAGNYLEEFGTYTVASRARVAIRRAQFNCLGSRVGATCDRVAASGTSCNGFTNRIPSKECLTFGSVGLTGVLGVLPADVRKIERTLLNIIREFDPGRIEYRELEIIADELDE